MQLQKELEIYQLLFQSIGMNRTAASVYRYLSRHEPTNVHTLHINLRISKVMIHKVLRQLVQHGFVEQYQSNTPQAFYKAMPVEKALVQYGTYLRKLAEPIIIDQA